jgi:DSBA-like thioredoxin domain
VPREIAATWDYRCPFARNGHEAIVNAVREGSDVDFRFLAFSLDQAHVEEGETPVWDRDPADWGTGTLALLYGIAIRDNFPDKFLDAHVELFAQRHDHGLKLGHEDVLQEAIEKAGLDVAAVKDEVWSGRPLATLAKEHTELVDTYAVFGVPTFITDDDAVFVRYMERGRADDLLRTLDLLEWNRLNEFKRTRLPR